MHRRGSVFRWLSLKAAVRKPSTTCASCSKKCSKERRKGAIRSGARTDRSVEGIHMKLARMLVVCAAVLPAAWGQKWEVGGGVGGGFYTSDNITSPDASASAEIQTGRAV